MKANEAPKKIYLFENPISGTPDDRWLTKRSCDDDIEYIRKDALIDKACTYWHEKAKEAEGEVAYYIMSCINDFKNYMKGG